MTSRRTRERLAERLQQEGIFDERVLEAIRQVPRHLFVDEALASRAYENTPLPIGSGQTISQPWVVARMTELVLENGVPDKVLEIGTGSGYQAAVLGECGVRVFSLERIEALARAARERLRELRYNTVRVRHADGFDGWADEAPFDAIVITAAPETLPDELLGQLAPGGRIVAPVGPAGAQELQVIDQVEDGFRRRVDCRVSFVPMLRGRS